jgi:Tol biopolymer transport system component
LEGGAVSPIRKLGSHVSSRVCLSPDGKYVAFDESTDPDTLNMDVFVMDSSGGQALIIAGFVLTIDCSTGRRTAAVFSSRAIVGDL